MSAHNWPTEGHSDYLRMTDPGSGGTITVDRQLAYVPIVSAGAEARTLARPTRAGIRIKLYFLTDGGTVTITVTGGYNAGGDTLLTFDTAGQFVTLSSAFNGTAYHWQLESDSVIGGGGAESFFFTMPEPQVATDAATLTAAQMLGRLLVGTPTGTAAYTTLTGELLTAAVVALHPNLAVGDCFDLTIINIGGTGDDITYTAGATGFSIVGEAIIRPVADSATDGATGQGTFRHRYASTNTWVAYRVG